MTRTRLIAAAAGMAAARLLLAAVPPPPSPAPRAVDLTAPDGKVLKATFFAAPAPGPGAILFEQSNRDRNSWAGVAGQLAAAGIHVLTVDMRGHGDTGGNGYDDPNREKARQTRVGDLDTAFRFLTAQPGVDRAVIGLGGAGVEGVDNAIRAAMHHPDAVRSLALLSGETFLDGLRFLKEASQLPQLYVFSDDDEYPPTVEAMELLYVTASSPSKKLVHYVAAEEAPWLWYEPTEVGRVPARGGHGTDLFPGHPELPGIIVQWFVTTLIRTPGHAPADTLASAKALDEMRTPGGVARVRQQLLDARKADPEAQLFPEITASIVGFDYQRTGDPKAAVEVLELVLLAYPTAAAHENLSEACLDAGEKDLARRHAEKSLEMLNARAAPASSWSDTEQFRGELVRGAQMVLEKTGRSSPKP